jgi:hypothetical protein
MGRSRVSANERWKSMKEIIVDGVKYVPVCESGPIKIVVIERGFVYVGRVEVGCDTGDVTIRGARSLIRWGSSQHLGELVNGPLENTKLGAPCTVLVRGAQVVHMIEVNNDGWNEHIN